MMSSFKSLALSTGLIVMGLLLIVIGGLECTKRSSAASLRIRPAQPEQVVSSTSIVSEADATSTDWLKGQGQEAVSVPTTSTSTSILRAPPMKRLLSQMGDPQPKKGEIAIQVPILMYHHIRPFRASDDTPKKRFFVVTPEAFTAQMESLVQAGYHTITPDDLERALHEGHQTLPDKPILLTFDDGFRDHYTVAFPVLKRLSLKAAFLVITDAHHLSGYMTDQMLKEVDASGFVTIVSHTENHPFLTHLSLATREKEILGSKEKLQRLLGHPVDAFGYPYGDANPFVLKEVERDGYALGFGVRLGSLHTLSSRYQLRRIRVLDREDVVMLADQLRKKLK